MKTLEELLNTAVAHHAAGELEKAAAIYTLLLEREPKNGGLVYLLGSCYLAMGNDGLAITLLTYAVSLLEIAPAYSNLGVGLRRIGNEEGALKCYQRALQLEPENLDTLSNLSGFYVNQGNPEECIKWSDACLKLDPDNYPAQSHRAIALLERGNYEQGFKEYRSRMNLPSFHRRSYECPEWQGEKTGTLAIHGEQGIGDEILFLTHVRGIPADQIVIECEPRLVKLIARSTGARCYGTHEELIAVEKPDAWIAMGCLPIYQQPNPRPYLQVDLGMVEHFRTKLMQLGPPPYVGLSWKGGTKTTHMHLRNAGIEAWQGICKQPGTFVSVQYGEAGAGHKGLNISHWQESIDHIDELAALLAALDLVISVCNSTIHLAGGVGTPCWVATPKRAAWRYGLTGSRMRWYDSVKLYRQSTDQVWTDVFERIGVDLANYRSLPRTESRAA